MTNSSLKWFYLKSEAVHYLTQVTGKKQDMKIEEALIKEIGELEHRVSDSNVGLLEGKKTDLAELRKKKIEGIIVRSRVKWIQHGEKPSSYFCNLENRNFVTKTMTVLEKDNGVVIHDSESMVKEAQCFYAQLYASKEASLVEVDLPSTVVSPSLSDEERDSIEGPVTKEKALSALKSMKNNKSPGSDGFTT